MPEGQFLRDGFAASSADRKYYKCPVNLYSIFTEEDVKRVGRTPCRTALFATCFQSGTLTVFIISRRTASASSLRLWSDEEKRELTTRRCAKTGRMSRFTSSGTQ